jgi:hypothetical protein
MIKVETILKPTEEIVSVVCNLCEAEMKTECSPLGNGVLITYQSGYDSSHFGDGTKVKFHLCESCLKELFDSLKIKEFDL